MSVDVKRIGAVAFGVTFSSVEGCTLAEFEVATLWMDEGAMDGAITNDEMTSAVEAVVILVRTVVVVVVDVVESMG